MIMKYTLLFAILALFFSVPPVQAEASKDITGLWLTQKRDAAVRVEACGDEICGYIAWLDKNEDTHSTNGQPLCNAKVLYGFQHSSKKDNIWEGGKIYKADDEKTYSGKIALINENTVELRAYLGLPALGKTKTLTRTLEKDYPACIIKTAEKPEDIAPAAGVVFNN